ncbi:dephospho-CoA kinase [Sphaerochaeta globosa]|jgi:dephospho-CoA kinase|uniref:Dephospho-CoA kinase n=1 Tax=Sphaerochaeta globosa (strain ATCC BAA-1886 / DSM 22777 / Buddy) TaxID=158189 RepID=F0RUZ2_SPHGB|nr:dephospho-CoA kinase [Sphaerochaeta globosa]ADY12643.1 Dephospho-CoA kinase [Sphaerochaeta globosa str. Buddy]
MLVIGITGKACAGKNVYASVFASFGYPVVDVDTLGHAVLTESKAELVETFGTGILTEQSIDRKKLGSLVFSDPQKLTLLEGITHPRMIESCKRLIQEARLQGKAAIILNAALLTRMGLDALCDHIVFIQAPFLVRYLRAKKRERLSWKRFLARDRAQKDIEVVAMAKKKPVKVLHNNRSRTVIHRQVATYCATIGLSISSLG